MLSCSERMYSHIETETRLWLRLEAAVGNLGNERKLDPAISIE